MKSEKTNCLFISYCSLRIEMFDLKIFNPLIATMLPAGRYHRHCVKLLTRFLVSMFEDYISMGLNKSKLFICLKSFVFEVISVTFFKRADAATIESPILIAFVCLRIIACFITESSILNKWLNLMMLQSAFLSGSDIL